MRGLAERYAISEHGQPREGEITAREIREACGVGLATINRWKTGKGLKGNQPRLQFIRRWNREDVFSRKSAETCIEHYRAPKDERAHSAPRKQRVS